MTHTHAKCQGHSVQKLRVETDRRTEAIALPPMLTWPLIKTNASNQPAKYF